jgi:O-methyltransferase domain
MTYRDIEPPTCDDTLIWDTFFSVWRYPLLLVADEFGLFKALDGAPKTADQVQQALSLGPRAAEVMLGILTASGFLAHRGGQFHLTDTAKNFLLPESPFYWGGIFVRARNALHAVAILRDALKRDPLKNDRSSNFDDKKMWESHQLNPEQARKFTAAMHSHSFSAATGVARRGDFRGLSRMLDVGGASGCFCIAIAERYPALRFTVADLPVVTEIAREYIVRYGLEDRIDTHPFDMFGPPWPHGYDGMFFANIFHDWSDDRCADLARRAGDALPSGGRIFLHEMLLDDTRTGPLGPLCFSLQMLLATEGKQRSAAEHRAILEAAGFSDFAVTPTYTYFSLVSARKP